MVLETARPLDHGENPYQRPAALCRDGSDDPLGLDRFEQLCGNLPCFINLADFDSVLETMIRLHHGCMSRFAEVPFIVIAAKHGNPCGMGASWDDRSAAVEKALWGNPRAVWGGELVMNFALDDDVAASLHRSQRRREIHGSAEWMLHVIGAPSADPGAVATLSGNAHRKVLINPVLTAPALQSARVVRPVRGGALIQPPPSYILDFAALDWPNGEANQDRSLDLLMAWAAGYTASCGGNEVALANHAQLLGLGGGPSTVDSVHAAVRQARHSDHRLEGAVFVADAFFPFTDGPESLCAAGVEAGVFPAGGQNFDHVVGRFAESDVAVGIIPEEYRGFCRH
jgi:phosphoribosylaminoimidazolecarboxamide formyltransferase/IMP cyclohydrolase